MATEKRLIHKSERADLIRCLKKLHDLDFTPGVYEHSVIGRAALFLEETADAVEVVRCEKCKHYQQYHKGRTEELCEWGKCKLISMDVDMPCNGFCCFGERRTEDG